MNPSGMNWCGYVLNAKNRKSGRPSRIWKFGLQKSRGLVSEDRAVIGRLLRDCQPAVAPRKIATESLGCFIETYVSVSIPNVA